VRPYSNVVLIELAIERLEAIFEPSTFDRDFEVLEPDFKQLIVGQCCPRKFPTWHDAARPAKI
jgi:hypothetical protein